MLVVGSANSSNSVRLVEVALESGARAAYLVDDASEIDEAWLEGVTTVGVTCGASVPEDLVDGVLDWLAERGYADVPEVRSAEETPGVLAAQGAAPRPARLPAQAEPDAGQSITARWRSATAARPRAGAARSGWAQPRGAMRSPTCAAPQLPTGHRATWRRCRPRR